MVASNVLTANSEVYYTLQPRPVNSNGRAIIWHHGAGGETLYSDPQYGLVNIRAMQQRLVDSGYTIVSCDFAGANTWANAGNQTKITDAVNWLGAVGCSTSKVALWGTSMGFTCLATWAKNNTAKVTCLVGTIPCADGQWTYTNASGVATAMNSAWSTNWVTNGKPTTDPTVIYASLITFPVGLWYTSDDPVVGAATATALRDLINGAGGAATATSLGTGGHADLMVPDLEAFVRFFELGNW